MKVIFLIPHVFGGGGERVLSDLSGSLGGETVLVVFERRFSYPFTGRIISLDLPINRRSLWTRMTGFLRRLNRFRKLLEEERPNVVISFMGEANLINALVGIRPVLTVHNHLTALSRMRGRIEAFVVDALNRLLYKRATVVAVSESIKSDLVQKFHVSENRVVVIPDSVNPAGIQKAAAEHADYPWEPGVPVVITVGRLSREKGQWHLIRAVAEVRRSIPCQLAIVGAGELEDALKRVAAEAGIDKQVYFLGWQSNPFKYMARASVFVSASLTEGFGLAVLEAMACGIPVIATDCPGGQAEIIAPPGTAESGLLVPAGAESELAHAITRMLTDAELRNRYVAAGQRRVKDFDQLVFAERYRALINQLTNASQR
jgi:glycosyltransferase involved in cell wall biosynthesis